MRTGADWRGVLEWRNDGVPLGTTSNEAAKLYDAAVSQFVGWYDDPNLGGLLGTFGKMHEADPKFVGGQALTLGLQLLSTQFTTRLSPELEKSVQELQRVAHANPDVPLRERQHVDAVVHFARGDLYKAALAWEDVLLEHPTDICALQMASNTYFYLGKQMELRDSVARVMPFWTSKAIPLKSYLHGMYAFGLVETNFFAKSEREARKGLEREPKDGWATHALAHVYEMEGRADEGIAFMSKTVSDWDKCNHLACHNYWHWALYHIEKGELDAAADLFETQILKRALNSRTMLDIVDCASLPFRLQLEDSAAANKLIGNLWNDVYSLAEGHLKDHILAFNDVHFMMALVGAKKFALADELVESATKSTEVSGKNVIVPLLKGILAYGRENFSEAVELLHPIRHSIIDIGGSDAQRDVFNQLLISAALQSPNHRKLVEHLIIERQALKDHSPLTDRYSLRLSNQI